MTENGPAGWYPAAPNSAEQRYWDGAAWTDFYFPPRPGQQLTAEQVAEQAAHQAAAVRPLATSGAAAEAPPRKRRKLVPILAAGVAVVVAATVVIVATHGGATAAPKLVNGYEYLPAVHVKSTGDLTFPAKYDLTTKLRSLGVSASAQGRPGYTDKVIGVYSDPEFTVDARVTVINLGNDNIISSAEEDVAGFADTTENEKLYGGGSGAALSQVTTHLNRPQTKGSSSWGLFKTYYVVQHYSAGGVKLKHPTVTPVIPTGIKLATPHVTVAATKGDPGSITFRWNKIKGATGYVVMVSSNGHDGQTNTIVATVDPSTTSWSSQGSANTTDYLNKKVTIYQNTGLETFGIFSADDAESGNTDADSAAPTLYGVMAIGGKTAFSSMGTVNSSIGAALPSINARNADKKVFPQTPVSSIDQVPLLFPYTSLDGATRQTRGTLKPGFVVNDKGENELLWQGSGTDLGLILSLQPGVDPNAFIAAYNAKSLAAAPKTGLSSLPVLASVVHIGGGPVSHTAPALGYPEFGSDAFTKYIAANMIAHKTSVDISNYPSEDVDQTVMEAVTQNPYIFDISGYQLSTDGTTLNISYGLSAAETTKLQKAVQAKVKSVVAAVVAPGMSDTAKVTALNNWVTGHVSYNYKALSAGALSLALKGYPKGFESAWDSDGALLDGSAVCAGYANAFDLLANAAGVKTVVVTGDVTVGGGHAWNKVEIDGAWKDVDTTWNDDADAPNQYLLINDDQFTGVATRTQDSYWMPRELQGQYATAK